LCSGVLQATWLIFGAAKFLQLHLTIEDEGAFTTPWTST
jgi:hypothetical protein